MTSLRQSPHWYINSPRLAGVNQGWYAPIFVGCHVDMTLFYHVTKNGHFLGLLLLVLGYQVKFLSLASISICTLKMIVALGLHSLPHFRGKQGHSKVTSLVTGVNVYPT